MRRKVVNEILTRLARAESAFLTSEFLAPVVLAGGVKVNIAGVRCTLHVIRGDFHGWGIFRPLSHHVARVERRASASERQRYLSLFPAVQLIVCSRTGGLVVALLANRGDRRFDISGPVAVQWAEECDLFDTLMARFDGCQFWFDQIDRQADPATAAYLRRELAAMTEPLKLERCGLSNNQRWAYASVYDQRAAAIVADERERGEFGSRRHLLRPARAFRISARWAIRTASSTLSMGRVILALSVRAI